MLGPHTFERHGTSDDQGSAVVGVTWLVRFELLGCFLDVCTTCTGRRDQGL